MKVTIKKIKITADNVQVTLPTKDTIPMYHVKCCGISQEVTDKVYDYFFLMGHIRQPVRMSQKRLLIRR